MENKENIPQEGDFKIKKRPKKLSNNKPESNKIDLSKKPDAKETEVAKIDLNKNKEEAIQTQSANDSNVIVEEKKDETKRERERRPPTCCCRPILNSQEMNASTIHRKT